jgi:hypothetical protein
MLQFVTLNTLTTDWMLTIRGSQLSQSEPISKRQLEGWGHKYRALLLKQDLDKGKMPNPDYIQTIQSLELEEVGRDEGSTTATTLRTFRTKIQVPNTIDLNFKSGFMYVGTINGQEIMFVAEGRSRWQQYNRYTGMDPIAYLKGGYIYVENDKEIRYITVRGVFEIPTQVSHLNNPNEIITDVTENSPYPIPIHMLPTLKSMILKGELGIESGSPSDNTTDSNDAVTPNVENK